MRKATPVDHLFWKSVHTCGGSKQNAPHPFCKTCGGCLVPECEAFIPHESSALNHFSPDGTCPYEKLCGEMEEVLLESKLQIKYLDQKFASTGTSAAVLSRIDDNLTRLEAQRKG